MSYNDRYLISYTYKERSIVIKRLKRDTVPRYKYLISCIITLFVIVFPFITYIHIEQLKGTSLDVFANTDGYIVDYFLYTKAIILIILSAFIILFFISEHIFPDKIIKDIPLRNKNAKYSIYILLGYTFLIIASCLMSKEKNTVLFGICTEYEGVFVLLSYIILFLAGYNYFNKDSFVRIFKIGLIVLMIFISVFSLIEYFYIPLYELNFMKYLISPNKYRYIAESMQNLNFKGQVSLSFYNPGYLGGMCAILFPISLSFAYDEENLVKKISLLVLSSGILFSLFVSSSTGAMYSTIFVTVLFIISMRKSLRKIMLMMSTFFLIILVLLSMTSLISGKSLFKKAFTTIAGKNLSINSTEKFELSDISLVNGELHVSSTSDAFIIKVKNGELSTAHDLSITDNEHNILPLSIVYNTINILDKGYENISIIIDDGIMILDCNYDDTIDFYITDNGFLLIGQNGISLDNIPKSNIKGFEGIYSLFTGRGYAWINTLPILKQCVIYGKGCGSFVFSFTQHDVVNMMNTHGSYKYILDKPHNWYLQIAVNTGVLSLILLLLLFGRYVLNGLKRYLIKKDSSTFEKSIFFSIISFLIVGLVNDSIITVNPFFWLLLGIGYYFLDVQDKDKNKNQITK